MASQTSSRPLPLALALPGWMRHVTGFALIGAWLAVVFGVTPHLSLQVASWLTFVAIVITPGYLLAEIVAWRLRLDWVERMAVAFSLGIASMAPAGMVSLLGHLRIQHLAAGWTLTVGVIVAAWLLHLWRARDEPPTRQAPWAIDELALAALLAAAFVYSFPILTLFKVDGDVYSFAAFMSEALSGRPMNVTEPMFGTGIRVGVRIAFNQYFAIIVLRAHLAHADVIQMIGEGSRSMLALWALFAAYMLGKAASNGSRRFGLFSAAVGMLIYLSGIFLRSDNVSSFFFERINADKFMVPVTMLPVLFALALRWVREGRREVWVVAALVTVAVSLIHPLIAAMQALALGAFGGLHLLFNLRHRHAWQRVTGLAALAVLVMIPALLQFAMVRNIDFAPTYPDSFEGWNVAPRLTPALPFYLVRGLDWYGEPPGVDNVVPADALTNTSPFLVWRLISNLLQRRVILFEVDRYITDPSYVLEFPFLLAFALLIPLGWRIHRDPAAQFVWATTLAVFFVMYNPVVTPLIGSLMVPWLMWRFIWLLPYALTIALATWRLLGAIGWLIGKLARRRAWQAPVQGALALATLGVAAVLLWPSTQVNLAEMVERGTGARGYPTPPNLLARLDEETRDGPPQMVMAEQSLSIVIPAYAANATVLAHRALTTSELFPAARQDEALERLLDQDRFVHAPRLTEDSIALLDKYDVRFVVATTGSTLDGHLRLAPGWFRWLLDDGGFTLFAVQGQPAATRTVQGNTALEARNWAAAERHFGAALDADPADALALLGMADLQQAQGQFAASERTLEAALAQADLPYLHYRLGRLRVELGQLDAALPELERAARDGTPVARFLEALGDLCLALGRDDCATEQYEASVALQFHEDPSSPLVSLGQLWTERNDPDRALALYEQAVALTPSVANQYLVANAYQSAERYDEAAAIFAALRARDPLSVGPLLSQAGLLSAQGRTDEAAAVYQDILRLQAALSQDTVATHQSQAQMFLAANRLDAAEGELERVLALLPTHGTAYVLLGQLYAQQGHPDRSIAAYQRALALDPSSVTAYTSLSGQLRQQAAPPDENLGLLRAATDQNPNNTDLLLSLGDQFQRFGQLDAALDTYRYAAEQLGGDSDDDRSQRAIGHSRALTFARLAKLHEDRGEAETAMGYHTAAVAAAPSAAWTHLALADALRRRGDAAGAEARYRQIIETYPTSVSAYLRLADLLQTRGETEAAAALYPQALVASEEADDDQVRARALLGLGGFFNASRQPVLRLGSDELPLAPTTDPLTDQALSAYTEALALDDDLTTVQALAQLHLELGQPDEAIALYQARIAQGEAEGWAPALLARYHSGLGEVYLQEHQLNEATATFVAAIGLDGWSPGPRLGLGRALVEQGRNDEAMAQFQSALQVAPGSLSAQLGLAQALDRQGEGDAALAMYQAAAALRPGDAVAAMSLARAWQERGDLARAEAGYRRVVELAPANAEAHVALGALHMAQARYREAEARFREAMAQDFAATSAPLFLGELMARLARYDEAQAAYERVILVEPADWRAYSGLAQTFRARGDLAAAIEQFRLAAAADKSVAEPLLALAAIFREQNEPDDAEQALLLALDRAPGDVAVRANLAQFYGYLNLDDEALLQLSRAVAENPDSMEALVRYGDELRRLGRDDEAEASYTQAEAIPTGSAAGYRLLAAARQAQGRATEARALLERAIELAPDEPANWIARGQLQAEQGNDEAALASLRRATEIAPAEGQGWNALGTTLLSLDRPAEALEALARAVEVEPTFLPTYQTLIQTHGRLDQPDEAEASAEAAREAVPGSYLAEVFASQVYQDQRRWDETEAALEAAIAKAPGIVNSYLELGDLRLRLARYEGALEVFGAARRVGPGDWRSYAGLGRAHHALGQIAEAVASYRQAADTDRAEAEPLTLLAALFREQNRPLDAEAALTEALARSASSASVRAALADLFQAAARGAESLAQLQTAVAENPDTAETLVGYANALRLHGREAEAERLYAQAEGLADPTDTGLRALALAREALGQRDAALALIERAIALAPTEPTNWIVKGQFLARRGDFERALAATQQATELRPGEGQGWQALGDALLAAGRHEEAIAPLQQAIAVEPTFLPAYGSLIQSFQALDRDADVAATVEAAQAAVPGSFLPDLYNGQYLESEQRWDAARGALAASSQKAPGVPTPLLSLGQLEQRQGNAGQAEGLYEQAIALRPGEAAAALSLVDLLASQGRNGEALAQTRASLAARPGDADLLLRLGHVQRVLGNYGEAETALRRAAQLDGLSSAPLAELGALYTAQGRIPEAIGAYERGAALQPTEESNYLVLSQLWTTQAEIDEAVAALNRGMAVVAEPAPLHAALSSLYLRQGQPDRALATVQAAIRQLGEEPELVQALAGYHLNRADFAAAEGSYRRALTLAPDEAEPRIALANFLLGRGRFSEARGLLQQAAATEPTNAATHLALGDGLARLGDPGGAQAAYNQALRLDPLLAPAYIGLAALHRDAGRWNDARAAYERGLSVMPTSSAILLEYSDLRFSRAEDAQALALLDRATRLDLGAETLAARAELLQVLGRAGEAERDLETALRVEPGSTVAWLALGNLRRAGGDVAAATDGYERAIAVAPGRAAGHVSLGTLAYEQGRLDEAWSRFDRAHRAEPASATPLLALGQARGGRGEWDAAEAAYTEAIAVAPLETEAYLSLSSLEWERSRNLGAALDWLERAEGLGVNLASVYRAYGDRFLAAFQSARTPGYYQQAIAAEPLSPAGHLALSSFHLQQGLPNEAAQAARRAQELAPRDPQARIAQGNVAHARGDIAGAEGWYRQAIALDATRVDGQVALATMLAAEGRYTDTVPIYQEAIARAPLDWSLWVALGDAQAGRTQYGEALAAYGRAATMNPTVPEPWLRSGDARMATEAWDAARAAYEQARTLRPDQVAPLLSLASFFQQREDLATAERYARDAVATDAQSGAAHAALGQILEAQERTDEAVRSFATAIRLNPRDFASYERWIRLQISIEYQPLRVDQTPLRNALAALDASADRDTLWGNLLLAMGYQRVEGATPRVFEDLAQAVAIDPVFAALYRQQAEAYEQQLNARAALPLWTRYQYATARSGDTADAQARIDLLLQVRIEQPSDGAALSGAVEIFGTATGADFQFYKLEYRPAGSDVEWASIGEVVTQPVTGGLLATWQVAELPPGDYRLRLTVVDNTGNFGPQDEITVRLAGSQPQ